MVALRGQQLYTVHLAVPVYLWLRTEQRQTFRIAWILPLRPIVAARQQNASRCGFVIRGCFANRRIQAFSASSSSPGPLAARTVIVTVWWPSGPGRDGRAAGRVQVTVATTGSRPQLKVPVPALRRLGATVPLPETRERNVLTKPRGHGEISFHLRMFDAVMPFD